MSRAAIYDALLNSAELQAKGFVRSAILVNYDGEMRPVESSFMVLAWNPDEIALRGDDDTFQRDFRNITIWVHILRTDSTDYKDVDSIINIIDNIFLNMIHVAGSDGYTVTLVEKAGRSRDMRDDSYETICRSASYRILSRETASV